MLPLAYIRHQIDGRLRLAVPSRQGDKPFFAAATEALKKAPGVETVRGNSATGTILIRHSGSSQAIAEWARAQRLFDYSGQPDPARTRGGDGSSVQRKAIRLDESRLLIGGFAALSAYRAVRGPYLGNAVENFWNGYQLTKFQKRRGWAAVYFSIGAMQLVGGRVLGAASSLLFYALTAHHASRISQPRPDAPPPHPPVTSL